MGAGPHQPAGSRQREDSSVTKQLPNLTAQEIRDTGILQEINRQLLHPRGLAMFVTLDPDEGEPTMGVMIDEDPEGWYFEWDERKDEARIKAERFDNLLKSGREDALGYVVQPLP